MTTKLSTPRVTPQLVPRPRLIERLDAGLHRKLTLISAPAGFGKTTLVAEWQQQTDQPFAWLSLDEGDNDPVRFFTHLLAALQRIHPDIGKTAQVMLQAAQLPPPEPLLTSLINDIAEVLQPFILVLDDYHLIEAQPIHDALAFLLDHLARQMHLVIATRADPPLSLSRLRGRGQLTELRTADLRFTPDETAAFLNHVMGLGLAAKGVAALETRTEGWIVGLQMAALSMQGRDAKSIADFIAAFTGSHRYVLDYLTDEVLLQQPESVRTFLLQTAILDRLTGSLCDALTGAGDGQQMLEQLDAANLFIVPLDDERRWYRYHHLFAQFLRTKLDRKIQPDLHLKAMHWFAAHGLLPEAVKHALASGDMDQASQMVASAAEGAFRTASYMTLSGWLNALPDELVRANCELATYKGILLFLTRQHAEAAAYADAAERSLAPDAPPTGRGRLQSLKAQLAMGDPTAAIQLAKEALVLLGEGDAFFRGLTLNVLGQILQMEGDIAAAVEVYREAVRIEREAGHQPGSVQLINLLFALNETGRRREALAMVQQVAEDSASEAERTSPLTEVLRSVCALLSYEANELSLAREQAERALSFCRQMNLTDMVFFSYYLLAQLHLASGEIDAMLNYARAGRQYAARLNLDLPYEPWLAAMEAQASLSQGDWAAALSWAAANGLSPIDTPRYWAEPVYLTYARLLIGQKQLEEAQTLLATMERSAQDGGRRRRLMSIYLQQALVQKALGHKEEALARIEDALHLAAPEGYRRAFMDEGPALLDLLPGVRHVAPQFVDELISAAGVERVVPGPQPLVEPLSERELEVLALIAEGLTNREIGQRLFITPGTVKVHTANIYGKLGVHSRTQAVAQARALDIL